MTMASERRRGGGGREGVTTCKREEGGRRARGEACRRDPAVKCQLAQKNRCLRFKVSGRGS